MPKYFFSEFSIPCYLCLLPNFPFKDTKEVFELVAKRYKILEKFGEKAKIDLGENSSVRYKKETDSFEISIDKHANIRHQLTDLIHELVHVVNYLENFKKGIIPAEKGADLREKQATLLELDVLKQISPSLYKAIFGQFLRTFWTILFEIELYKNPRQDLSKLYARTFNRCFKGATQKKNRTYILNENIVLRPLSLLPHAIAGAEIALSTKNNSF